jgi:hypothetical protein
LFKPRSMETKLLGKVSTFCTSFSYTTSTTKQVA